VIIAQMLESDGPGGAELVVLRLSIELRRRGHDVVPVGPTNGVGWLGERFREAGFEPEQFGLRRAVDPSGPRRLAEMLTRRGVQAVHSHEFTMCVYGAAAARRLGVPHVTTMHGSQTMTQAWRRRAALRWAYRRSRAVVAVSEATRLQLEADLGLRPGVLTLVRNGVPVVRGDRARARAEFGLRDDDVMVLAVGNLDPRKGHRVLLGALQQLVANGLDVPWHLVIAGGRGGPEREPLLAFAAEHGLADRVHVLGQREDVPDLQAAADIFAMPSLWEGLPLALLEGMIAGNACVASRTSGIPEAITDGEHGVLVPPGDVNALATALAPLLRDPALRARYGQAAYARAMQEFTIEAMTDRYEALLGIGAGVSVGAGR
jgi:glycosyltransferase involved in cell wall biosynthesis